jgi:3D (Asp-Asp-Asp) domain-containing protein
MRISRATAFITASLLLTSTTLDARPHRTKHRHIRATATAYCQRGEAKDGTPVHPGVIAADPNVLPLGSVVDVNVPDAGLQGVYTVRDTGSAVKGQVVDIYMPSCARAKRFGRKSATVHVLKAEPKSAVDTKSAAHANHEVAVEH